MNYTTIEQSNKLVELGLNPDSADMKWFYWKDEIDASKIPTLGFDKAALESYKNTQAVYLPCWSLGALLELMPDGTSIFYKYNYTTIDMVEVNNGVVINKHREEGHSPFEALYSMIVWLLENGYIKTKKK